MSKEGLGNVDDLFDAALDSLERLAGGGRWLANLWFEEGMRVEADTDAPDAPLADNPGKIKESERWQEASISLQYELAPGRVGFACAPISLGGKSGLNGTDAFDAESLLARAAASAGVIEPDAALSLPEALGKAPESDLKIDDGGWETLSSDNGLELAWQLGEAVRAFSGEIDSVRKPTFEATRERRLVALGGAASARAVERLGWSSSDYSLQVEAASRRGEHREGGWSVGQSRSLAELDPVAVGTDAGRRTVEPLGGGEVPTGRFDVVLDWRVTTQILELLAPSLIGESHLKKTTFLLGRVGEKIFSDRVAITDDGTLPGGPDTQPLDEEGTPRGRTVCVEGGRLERLLYDRASSSMTVPAPVGGQ